MTADNAEAGERVSTNEGDVGARAEVPVRPRLPCLDGVRGLAALVVILFHCTVITAPLRVFGEPVWRVNAAQLAIWPVHIGGEMVALFLIVSGFSLSWTEDGRRSRGRQLPVRTFYLRRLRRVGPVYYLALAWGLLVTLSLPMNVLRAAIGLDGVDQLSVTGFVAHLSLVQNLRDDWSQQANGPLWTLAVEVQLYVLFPAVFWLFRRSQSAAWSVTALMVLAGVDVVAEHIRVLPGLELLRWFALGCFLSTVWQRVRVPARQLAFAGLGLLAVGYAEIPFLQGHARHDAVWGGGLGLVLLAALRAPDSRWNVGNWRVFQWLGPRSYALYAFHLPVLMIVYVLAATLGARGLVIPAALLIVGVPASLLVGDLAWRLVDRRATEWSRRAS